MSIGAAKFINDTYIMIRTPAKFYNSPRKIFLARHNFYQDYDNALSAEKLQYPREGWLMNNLIHLEDVIFVDDEYSFKHPHMIHRHEKFLELLYIAQESGRYIVGDYEYAVLELVFIND